jgi:dihydrofolate reductase
MRKLILKMSVSTDGFMADAQGGVAWLFDSMEDKSAAWLVDRLWAAGAHVMGRETFHAMMDHWPKSQEVFAEVMNALPKIVFSKKGFDPKKSATGAANEASWANARVLTGELVTEIETLKKQEGKDLIAYGGVSFAHSLIGKQLIDEYWLYVHPVALGTGAPLFPKMTAPLKLNLQSSTAFSKGLVVNVYNQSETYE